MNLPNVLTTIRFVLIGVFLFCFWVPENYTAACIVYIAAAITDILDGYIARHFNMVTDIGKLIDPLADKLMLIAALISFYLKQMMPLVIPAIVIIKELMMILGGLYLYKKKVVVGANWIGKIATIAFNVGVVLTFFSQQVYPWNTILLYLAVVFGIAAFLYYLIKNFFSYCKSKHAENNQD